MKNKSYTKMIFIAIIATFLCSFIISVIHDSYGSSSSNSNRDDTYYVRIVFGGTGCGNVTLTNLTTSGSVTFDDDQNISGYSYGDEIKLEAFPDVGNKFGEWIGGANSYENPIEITVDKDLIIMVKFIEISEDYFLKINNFGDQSNTVELTNISREDSTIPVVYSHPYEGYLYGEIVNLKAIPLPDSEFIEWSGAISSTENPINITMTQNYTIIAEFEYTPPPRYNLTLANVNGDGTIKINGSEVSPPWTNDFAANESVDLEAIADPLWNFSHWSRDINSTANVTTIIMDSDKTINATFKEKVYLTINHTGNGNTNPLTGTHSYAQGTSVTLNANADPGWGFVNWSGPDADDITDNGDGSWSITIDEDKQITANFIEEEYIVNLSFIGCGIVNASYNLTSKTLTENGSIPHNFTYNEQLTLRADSCTGWEFSHWQIQEGRDVNTSNPLYLRVLSDLNITVTFILGEYQIIIHNPRNGTGYIDYLINSTEDTFDMYNKTTKIIFPVYYNETISLYAYPHYNSSYFEEWSYPIDLNPSVDEHGWLNFSMPDDDIELEAPFWLRNFSVNITISYKIFNESLGEYELYENYTGLDMVYLIPDEPHYHYWENVTLQAVSANRSTFLSWDGDVPSGQQNQNPTTITINENKTITAYFEPPKYNLTIIQNGSGEVRVNNETVTQSSSSDNTTVFYAGSIVHLEAIPDTENNWTFLGWFGDLSSTENKTNITMNQDYNITAHFVPPVTLEIIINGSGTTDPTPSPDIHVYPQGRIVNISATADPGWSFKNWSGNFNSILNPAQVIMNTNKTIYATFEEDEYIVNITFVGCGVVNYTYDSISDTLTKSGLIPHNFTYNEQLTIRADSCTGWEFSHWQIQEGRDVNTSNPLYLRVLSDLNITVTFILGEYQIIIHNPRNGTGYIDYLINSTEDTFDMYENDTKIISSVPYNETVSLHAYPHYTSYFEDWSYPIDLNSTVEGNGWLNFSMIGRDIHLEASFWLRNYTINVSIGYKIFNESLGEYELYENYTGPDMVYLKLEPDGNYYPYWQNVTYHYWQNVTLQAVSANGSTFLSWDGDVPTGQQNQNPTTITINENKTLTAYFEPPKYNLTITINGSGQIRVENETFTSSIWYKHFYGITIVDIEAIPNTENNWTFLDWSGDLSSTENNTNITLDKNKTITANFVPPVTLEIIINGNGTTNPSEGIHPDYPKGSIVNISATADPGWSFKNWSGDFNATLNPAQIIMNTNKTIYANFEEDEYSVYVNINGCGNVTAFFNNNQNQLITRPGEFINYNFTYNEQFTLSASECTGYSLDYWEIDDGSEITMKTNITIYERTLSNLSITAFFIKNKYTLNIHNHANGTGYIDHSIYDMNDTSDLEGYQTLVFENVTFEENVSLYAYPHENSSYFTRWKYNSSFTPDDHNGQWLNFTMPAYDLTLDVMFWYYNFTLNINFNYVKYNFETGVLEPCEEYSGNETVEKDPDRPIYHYGNLIDLTAMPTDYTTFYNWSGHVPGGESTNNPIEINMTSNKTITATFNVTQICVDIELYEGYNLITIPIQTDWHAFEFGRDLENKTNANCSLILDYDAQNDTTLYWFPQFESGDNFSIIEGKSYFIIMDDDVSYTVCGTPVFNACVPLYGHPVNPTGYNFIGWYHYEYDINARSLGENISNCTMIMRLDSQNSTSDNFVWEYWFPKLNAGDNFKVECGIGYVVWMEKENIWCGEG